MKTRLLLLLAALLAMQTAFAQNSGVSSLPDFDEARFTTTTLYENDEFRVVGFAFRAGQALPEHAAPVDAYLVVTEGIISVSFCDDVYDLGQGDGIVLPKDVRGLVQDQFGKLIKYRYRTIPI